METAITAVLAEDDAPIRRLLTAVLERAGLKVVAYGDSSGAIDHIRRGAPCHVLLIDLMTPSVNGWKVLSYLKGLPPSSRPFLTFALSAGRDSLGSVDGEIVACLITKPFDIEFLGRIFSGIAQSLHRGGLTVVPPLGPDDRAPDRSLFENGRVVMFDDEVRRRRTT